MGSMSAATSISQEHLSLWPMYHQTHILRSLDGRDKTTLIFQECRYFASPRHTDFAPDAGAKWRSCPLVEYFLLQWVHSAVRCPGSVLLSAFSKSQYSFPRWLHASPQTTKYDQAKNGYAVYASRRAKLEWQSRARNLEKSAGICCVVGHGK